MSFLPFKLSSKEINQKAMGAEAGATPQRVYIRLLRREKPDQSPPQLWGTSTPSKDTLKAKGHRKTFL